jgi:LPXTG-site transpeptidase (sortase) family protein
MSDKSHFAETVHHLWENKIVFGLFFITMFLLSFALLYVLDLVPEELRVTNSTQTTEPSFWEIKPTQVEEKGELPVRISIASIGVNTIIQNPSTTNATVLDELLTKGSVRYPGSGLAGKGNMFLFGHSTGLRVVNNQAYKAFNNIKTLNQGDEITVYSDTKKYIYAVRDVKLVDSNEAWVDLSVKTHMLTISTCNTFGKKEERHVVQADFVRSESL